jgi:RNA polymerase sigma-70 factor (ECF subfamily)
MDDDRLYDALRAGDEEAFTALVDRYHSSLVRLAMAYVRNLAAAEEVVQETWLGVVRGLARFERRSSLKTWIFRILVNRAKTHARRDGRAIPFSALEPPREAAVDPERFLDGRWGLPPSSWSEIPEDRLLARETRAVIDAAIASLPPAQAQVIVLRDVVGWSSEDVCALLEISEANQRVLLHRARSKVRAALELYLEGTLPA